MLKNYMRIALRNLKKHKAFSIINIFGLSVGLSCCMLISLYIYHEYSYDSHHLKKERLYQLWAIYGDQDQSKPRTAMPAPLAGALQQNYPEIEASARLLSLFQDDKTLLQYQDPDGSIRPFYETKGYVTDPEFFELFTYDFVEGDPATALLQPNSLVLSEEVARKLFGSQPAQGKVLRVSSSTNGDHNYTITGVFRPSETPSHIDARFFLSVGGGDLESFFRNGTDLMNNNMFHTYLLLKDGTDPAALEAKFPAFVAEQMGEQLRAEGLHRSFFLSAVQQVHLNPGLAENVTPGASPLYLRILASIAVLTLLIACINFMNLSTARSSKRSVEVGVRKVLGAEKNALVWQFLGESLLLALVALLFSFLMVWLLLPLFSQVSGRDIELSLGRHGMLLAGFVLLAVFTGLLAGSYPAFYLSSFKPVRVLKGRFSSTLAATSLRKGLVVFQFVISVVLIVASIVIARQMHYLRAKDLGFVKDQQLVIPLRSESAKANYQSLKTQLARQAEVKAVGASFYYPGIFNPIDWAMYGQGGSIRQAKPVHINFVDDSFLQTLGIKILAGRLFSPAFPADTNNHIILNEKGVKEMGFASADEALGKWIANEWRGEQRRFTVIGVVQDFHFKDLRIAIEPYGFMLNNSNDQNYLIANLSGGNMAAALSAFEQEWNALNPHEPFEYSFLDQDFQENYKAESRLAGMIRYFTLLAITISCLGLFGLATFSAEQRIKEIGIRKVLGAPVSSLVALLSVDFLKLVLLAIVLASPLAWYIMQQWLQTFAYRIAIGWQVFALTFGLAMLIAFCTVGYQALKASLANPVKNLRTE